MSVRRVLEDVARWGGLLSDGVGTAWKVAERMTAEPLPFWRI